MKKSEIEEILSLSDSELFTLLGKEVAPKSLRLRASPESPDRQEEHGRKWWSINGKGVKEQLCANKKIQLLIEKGEAIDAISVCVAVIDLFEQIYGGVHACVIGAVVIRMGLKKICS